MARGPAIVLLTLTLVASSETGSSAAGATIGLLAGFTIPSEAQTIFVNGQEGPSEAGDDVFALEIRADDLILKAFLVASYAATGSGASRPRTRWGGACP